MNHDAWTASRRTDVVDRARAWLLSDEMRDLIAQAGGPIPSIDHLQDLRTWSQHYFDTRHGAERHDTDRFVHPPAVIEALVDAAEPLGLMHTPPATRSAYDTLVILAGTATGNRLRTALAHSVLEHVATRSVVALASDRELSPSERTAPSDVATEWQDLKACLVAAFGPLRTPSDRSGDPQDQEFIDDRGQRLKVTVVPRVRGQRPTTREQLRFLNARTPRSDRDAVLIVTSAIYVPYQFFSAAPELLTDTPHHAEMIGTPTSRTVRDDVSFAQRVAQEIHAAIDAATSLVEHQDP